MIGLLPNHVRSQTSMESTVVANSILPAPDRSYSDLLCLALLSLALGYAVWHDGGVNITDWNVSVLILALAAIPSVLGTGMMSAPPVQTWLRWAILLFPCYVAFQLIPLPLFVVRIVSPERAQLLTSVKRLVDIAPFAPLTINLPATFTYLIRIVSYTLTFLLTCGITARSSRQRLWIYSFPLIIIAAAEAGYGFLHQVGDVQVQGTYANKNHFAGLMEMVLPFAIMYAIAVLRRRDPKPMLRNLKFGAILPVALLILAGLAYSISRMGFVSGIFGMFAVGALVVGTFRVQLWRKSLLLAGLALILLFLFVFFPPDELVRGFGNLLFDGVDTEGRWPIWIDTLHLLAAYPVFGCGLGNYETAFLKYQTAIVDRDFTFAHNDYLQLAAELGAVGFAIVIILMFGIFKKALEAARCGTERNVRYIGLACTGGMAAIGLHSVADFNMYIPANAMLLAWICGMAVGLPLRSKPVGAVKESMRFQLFSRAFVAAIASLLLIVAPAWLVFEKKLRDDPPAEAMFCHFGICDTDSAIGAQKLNHGTVPAMLKGQLLTALRREPAAPQRWCDLGQALLNAGETERARYCFSKAVSLAPNVPLLLVRAADFQFALKENRKALELMARVLALDPGYQDIVLTDYEQRKIPVDQTLRYGIPQESKSFKVYMRRLLYQNRTSDAMQTWGWVTSHHYADDKLANEYVEFLIGDQEFESAAKAWAHYVHPRDKTYPESNSLFNGDFESDPTGSRFDWIIDPPQGATIGFDRAVHHSGARSLRIQFDGTQNVSNAGVWQTVFLKPGFYRFQAYARTQNISTDKGVAFNVVSRDAPNQLNFTTDSMLGTNDWKQVERVFRVVAGTKLIQVSLVRKPSLRFDNLIRGTVWVDQVSITPARPAE